MVNYICKIIKNNKPIIFKFYLIYIITIVISILLPFVSGKFIDVILSISKISKENVILFFFLYIILLLFNIFMMYLVKTNGHIYLIKLSYYIKKELINSIYSMPYSDSHVYETGYLLSRIIQDSHTFATFILNNIINLFNKTLILIVTLNILFRISKLFFIFALFFIPIYLVLYKISKNEYSAKNLLFRETNDKFTSKLYESLSVIKEVKIDSNANIMLDHINDNFDEFSSTAKLFYIFSERYKSIDSMTAIIFQIFALLTSAYQIYKGNMTIGEFTSLNAYFIFLVESIRFYADFGKVFQEIKLVYNRIFEILNEKDNNYGSITLDQVESIILKNISFGYIENKLLYTNLNLKFDKDYSYCIMGINGKGKSTLIYLICGLLEQNTDGTILFNNININKLDIHKLRKNNMAVMTQDTKFQNYRVSTFLNLDSLLSNLSQVIHKYNLEKIYYTDNFIYNVLSKKISQLSGGEKQKVCLLKALLKDSDVLILDEPSSSLDQESTKILIDTLAILKKDKIVIIISHDEIFANYCDFKIYL